MSRFQNCYNESHYKYALSIEEYEEGESEQIQISAYEVNESDDEYVPAGKKWFRKSLNQ